MKNAMLKLLVGLVKAKPQMLITVLQMLVDYLKENPAAAGEIIDALVKFQSSDHAG